MKIDKLEISNFRGFGEFIELSLKKDINIFVGVNGSGKSSLLDLIAMFLNELSSKIINQPKRKKNNYYLTYDDINTEEEATFNKIFFDEKVTWQLQKGYREKEDLGYLNEYVKKIQMQLKEDKLTKIPIFKYFQSQRGLNNKNKPSKNLTKIDGYKDKQLEAYEGAFEKKLSFDNFISWFIEEENQENRTKVSKKDLEYTSPYLDDVRKAIEIFLNNFPSDKYNNLRVNEQKENQKEKIDTLVINKNGKPFNLDQLSDGEKILILMVADIAHRLSLANSSVNSLQGSGIVLIDKIDLHLHPSWQREVVPCFKSTFPNIQFFITTHSPQVVSNVDSENIFIIEDFNIVQLTPKTLGKDTNSILWDIFGEIERPKKYKDKFEKMYDLLDEDDKEKEAQLLLSELTEKLGEDNPDIVKAKLHFEFQKSIEE